MMVLILARGKRVEKMQTLECVLFSYFLSVEGCYQRGSGAWETGRHVLLVELEPLNSVQTPLGPGANI